jgi:hypothetical protein
MNQVFECAGHDGCGRTARQSSNRHIRPGSPAKHSLRNGEPCTGTWELVGHVTPDMGMVYDELREAPAAT